MKKNFTKILLVVLSFIIAGKVSAKVLETDSLALVALYDSTDGYSWTKQSNWKSYKPVSEWSGVSANEERVTALILDDCGLNGELPSELGDLTGLEVLVIHSNNKLTGIIPKEIGQLTNLTGLNLSANSLSGAIPNEIGQLTNLTILHLQFNEFNGVIPQEIGNLTQLTDLDFSHNKLSGAIPAEIGALAKLVELKCQRNDLSGEIPAELGGLDSLTILYLDNNKLSGAIPAELGQLNKLQRLFLDYNELSGVIPSELGNLKNLIYLYLRNNNLSGEIPAGLGGMSSVYRILLEINQLSGVIPKELGRLGNLETLSITGNKISGVTDSLKNLTKLKYLRLGSNSIVDLPDFSTMTWLQGLNVYANKLTFEDLEPNAGIHAFQYNMQDSIGLSIDTTLSEGGSYTMMISTGGDSNLYQWYKDGEIIEGADSCVLTVDSLNIEDSGSYNCQVTNTIATKLTLFSRHITITVKSSTAISDNKFTILPKEYALLQNYPNPFNPSTKIDYSLPQSEKVTIEVYNLLGQRIATLVNTQKSAGNHSLIFNAAAYSAGLYFYSIKAGNFYQIKKMLLVK